jgi:hypothetical protein
MSQAEPTNRLPPGVEVQGTAKKPYHKPAVRYEQVFETRALTCGKVQATQSACHFNRHVS